MYWVKNTESTADEGNGSATTDGIFLVGTKKQRWNPLLFKEEVGAKWVILIYLGNYCIVTSICLEDLKKRTKERKFPQL